MPESTAKHSVKQLVGARRPGSLLRRRDGSTDAAPPAADPRGDAVTSCRAPGTATRAGLGLAGLLYFVLVISAANSFFTLVPWFHVKGKFNLWDVGNALVMLGLVRQLLRGRNLRVLRNPLTPLIVSYLAYVPIEAALASIHFHQSVLDGLIAMRHQLYYLSFFVFLLVFDSLRKIERFLNALTVVAVILIVLSIVNYTGFTVYYGGWAHGWGVRAGITRAYIPGMDILSLAFLWESSKWIGGLQRRVRSRGGRWALVLAGAHFFRQTRSRVVALTVILVAALFSRRRFRAMAIICLVGLMGVGASLLFTKHNLILHSYTSAVNDLQKDSGTWEARTAQIQVDMAMFEKYPIFGSGAAALRLAPTGTNLQNVDYLAAIAHMEDLGYTHWLKAYGLIGVVWLVIFFYVLWARAKKFQASATGDCEALALFCTSYVGFLVISFLTLNQLTLPPRIILVCLVAAILVRMTDSRRSRPV